MVSTYSGGALGVGGGGDVIEQAASSAIPAGQDVAAQVQQLLQQLQRSRVGPGGGITYGPQMKQPITPRPPIIPQGPGIPQGSFATTGEAKRADKQALFGTVADIVHKAEQQHYDQKVQKMTQTFQTLAGAIQGYNEAKASGNQEVMKHNANIINSIVSDPKKSKELAKAFDVNLNPLAEDKKKQKQNPANDALKKAFAEDTKSFASGQSPLMPQAQAFMRAMPQTAQVDPRTAIVEQLTKSGVLPKAGEELTFQKDIMQIQERAQANKLTNDDKVQMAKMLADSRDRATQASLQRTLMTIWGAHDRSEIMADAWKYRADKTLKGVMENPRWQIMKDNLKAKGDDPNNKAINTLVKTLDSQVKDLQQQATAAGKAHDSKKLEEINKKLEGVRMQQQIVSGVAAQRLGLNPEDFSNDPLKLDDQSMQEMLLLFGSGGDDASTEP